MAEAPMHPRDRTFWVSITLFGTVFGYGIYAFIEKQYWWGGSLTPFGLVGLVISISTVYREDWRGARTSLMIGGLLLTWVAIGYDVWYGPKTTSESYESEKSTLVGWLQQAQRERDEAKQGAAVAEAQKDTLMGWIQQAQRERDNSRQELNQLQKQMQDARLRAPSTIALPPEKRPADPKVCAYLLQELENAPQAEARNQQQHVWHELGGSLEKDVRAILKTVGCLPD
jgi:hypothetical protein